MATKKKAPGKKKSASLETEIKYHLIEKYRGVVAERYEYNSLKKAGLPKNFTPKIVASLRTYFLENLYPEISQREKLDAAFAELENYVMHPSKVWDLLGNITSAIFKFGFQFPAAAKAGFVSLEAYTSAKHFENTLTHAAIEKGYTVPLSDDQFYNCLVSIPKNELEKFITELEHLFATFTNTELLGKTISIMQDVVIRMERKGDMYSSNEIDAIQLGLEIMQKGYDLFIQYDDEMKQSILDFIVTNERAFMEGVYRKK
ncbi:MAG: hypothetical protein U0T74_11560 [Chitinophagales bacterium]